MPDTQQQKRKSKGRPDAGSNFPWPEEYQDLQPLVQRDWGIEGEIYLNRNLGGGKSGAMVYAADLTSRDFTGQAILKFDRSGDPDWSEKMEFERHRRALEANPDYAAAHFPKLVHALTRDDKVAVLSTIAGRGLEYAVPWADCPYKLQLSIARRLSTSLLEDWNHGYSLDPLMLQPQDLLEEWLDYRLDPERGGRIHAFLADDCGIPADEASFTFEGFIYPNPLTFAKRLIPLPEAVCMRAIRGNIHGDLNDYNVLVSKQPARTANYYLIDLAFYESDAYLFYDHAYFELTHLLRRRRSVGAARWRSILRNLSRFGKSADEAEVRSDDVGLLKLVEVLRREVANWVDRHEPNRLSYLDSQYLLARIAVGMNFTHKRLPLKERFLAFTYAASNVADYLQLYGVDWPKHGPELLIPAGDEEKIGEPTSRVVSARADERSGEPAAVTEEPSAHPPLPQKPSVAVIAFRNLGDDPDQEYFCDGITSEIVYELGRIDWLMAISGRSSHAYEDQASDPSEIGQELGVRYVVEGTVQKSEGSVRIAVQLTDTRDSSTIWTERYDRDRDDIFAVQEEIALSIAANIDSELARAEQQRAREKRPEDLDAWDLCQQSAWHFHKFTLKDNEIAADYARKAIAISPDFSLPYVILSRLGIRKVMHGGPDRDALLRDALENAERAVSLDEGSSLARVALGFAFIFLGRHDASVEELETAIALNPSSSRAHFVLGFALLARGDEADAISLLDTAIRLSPKDPLVPIYIFAKANAEYFLGDYEAAEKDARQAGRSQRARPFALITLAFVLARQGRLHEARAAIEEAQKRNFHFVGIVRSFASAFHPSIRQKILEDAAKLGITDRDLFE